MVKKQHICILTTAHPIDDVRVNEKIAQTFLARGYRVSWVGPDFAFVDSEKPKASAIEFWLTPKKKGKLGRAFAFYAIRRLASRIKGIDVFYAPEPDSAVLALYLARRIRARIIFDIHEVYHGPLLNKWLGGFQMRWFRESFRFAIRAICCRCDLVIGVSESVLNFYSKSPKSIIVRNCAPSWFADGPIADVSGSNRTNFTLMHGKRAFQRGTVMVLEALAYALKTGHNIRVIIFNQATASQDPELAQFTDILERNGLASAVDLRNGVTLQQMPNVLSKCDVGIIAYGKELGLDSLPNRIFEYMAAGLPVIIPKYATEMAKIVEKENCGLSVNFEDAHDIAQAIVHLWLNPEICREMGKRGRNAFLQRHNWDTEIRPVIDIINLWAQE